ncbi:peptide ABC transporter ATP-binding protein [Klebsiella pneumoniae]|uniref:Peptide ABC transporter ATP-binding protein n=1 Tax=Klebsiella pneumoniae TaxID=573 RepID=A0A3S4KDC7_KLEPN|nr:peptide ABC transporter ATP-binding protein [Klebsiella pneumoniae]
MGKPMICRWRHVSPIRIVALSHGQISDDMVVNELKDGGGSAALRRQWLALPEHQRLFSDEEMPVQAGGV